MYEVSALIWTLASFIQSLLLAPIIIGPIYYVAKKVSPVKNSFIQIILILISCLIGVTAYGSLIFLNGTLLKADLSGLNKIQGLLVFLVMGLGFIMSFYVFKLIFIRKRLLRNK